MIRNEVLDYLRFFAVLMVVLFHYTYNGIVNGKISSIDHIPHLIELTKYGYLGVELFFMISGYVIFYSANHHTAFKFTISRLVRLYPAYWFAILFTSFFSILWANDLMNVELLQILVNFTMLQAYLGFPNVDGVYWTLVLEIQFYFAVLLLLIFKLKKYLKTIFIIWPYVMFILFLMNINLIYFSGYFSYFAAGTLFAILKERKDILTIVGLIISYFLSLNFSIDIVELKEGIFSKYIVAMIITLFFLVFIFQNIKNIEKIKLPKSKLLGALTYPIYLIHAHFGYMFISKFATNENKIIIYILIISIVLSVSLFINKIIEVKLKNIWINIFTLIVSAPLQIIPKYFRKGIFK